MVDPVPFEAWQCVVCHEIYLGDYEEADKCCEEAVILPPRLRLVR